MTETTQVHQLVKTALAHWQSDDYDSMWRDFSAIHRTVKKNGSALPQLSKIADLGKVYMIMTDHLRGGDEDYLQQIASVGYYLISTGCETLPANRHNFIKDRYLIEKFGEDYFIHTVISGLGENMSGLGFFSPMNQMPSTHWSKLYAMQYTDLVLLGPLVRAEGFEFFREGFDELEDKRQQGYFGRDGQSQESLVQKGWEHHAKLREYLHDRLVKQEDFDF